MIINNVKQKHDLGFGAKLYPYPHTCTNKEILKNFETRTKEFPSLILKQDTISYSGKDYFILLDEDKSGKLLSRGWFTYTGNHPKTFDKCVESFVRIFNSLQERSLTGEVTKE